MALVLGAAVRTEIIARPRYVLGQRGGPRLPPVLWAPPGRTGLEFAALLGVTARQVRKWLRLFRTQGLEALCTLGFRGDPGKLRPAQVKRLKEAIATGCFLTAQQIGDWVQETFRGSYSARGMRGLLHRLGINHHKATGFFWKADPAKQEAFLQTHARQKQQADGRKTRRYFVDACHPVWGVELLYDCWLLVGQRLLVGVGGGRKRLNLLGAY